jgi:hypothetical protein
MMTGILVAVILILFGIYQLKSNRIPMVGFFITLVGVMLLIVSVTSTLTKITEPIIHQLGIQL